MSVHDAALHLRMLVFAAALIGAFSSAAQAVTLEARANQDQVSVGDTVDVVVVVAGLVAGAAPSIGSYDIVLTYDPDTFAFEEYAPSRALGAADLNNLTAGAVEGASSINFYAVSFYPTFDLHSIQGSSVLLLTASFTALAGGMSTFGIAGSEAVGGPAGAVSSAVGEASSAVGDLSRALGDELGAAIAGVEAVSANVTVAATAAEVPTVTTTALWLFALTLLVAGALALRRASR